MGKIFHLLHIQRHDHTSVLSLLFRIGEIGWNLCHVLHLAQTAPEERFGFCKLLTFLCLLLLCHKLRVGAHLRLNCFAIQQVAYLMDKHVVRCTIANQVVNVAQQVHGIVRPDNLEAEEHIACEVERTDKLMLVTLQFAFRQCAFGYIKAFALGFFQCLGIQRLLRFGFAGYEVHKQCRVVQHGFLYRIAQCFRWRLFRQLNAERNVI